MYDRGSRFSGPLFTAFCVRDGLEGGGTCSGPRIGFTVPRKLGPAVVRNRIKRRLREVLRRHIDLLPAGCDLILHPHRSVLSMEFTKLDAEVVRILTQANAEQARAATISPRSGKAESAS